MEAQDSQSRERDTVREARIASAKTRILKIIRTKSDEEAAEELAEAQINLEDRALKDPKTGLKNVDTAQEELGRMLAFSIRHSTPLTAMAVDLDGLKKVNDTLGHQSGDKVILAVAEVVKKVKREEDLACKYPKGDEFFLFLPGTDLKGAKDLAERIREEIPKKMHAQGFVGITASIGLSTLSKDYLNAVHLKDEADKALLKAKQNGKNRVEVFNSGDQQAA